MKARYRNLFFLFGLIAIAVMIYSFDVTWEGFVNALNRGGFYLLAVIGVWVFVYAFNALAYRIIVNTGAEGNRLSFLQAFRLTVSGFAFSYTTPFGSGGAPYRIMELSSYIGMNRAMSSTVLYSMMHIFSHFCLWVTAAILFPIIYFERTTILIWAFIAILLAVSALVAYFFYRGYKNGMIVKCSRLLMKIPFLRNAVRNFFEKNQENMEQIDRNIAYLHERPKAFYSSLGSEYLARVINSLEFYFILLALGVDVSFWDGLFVLAFSSLIGNMLFFFPMQLGAREGGLAAVLGIIGKASGGVGIYTSIFTRIRELFWIAVGVAFVKFGNKLKQK